MQLKWRAVLLGLAAFLLALLVVLPASWVSSLLPAELQCASWRGSVWRGQCVGLKWNGGGEVQEIDLLRWRLHPQALFSLVVRADLQLRGELGEAAGQLELGRGGRLALHGASANIVFDRRIAAALPAGWVGQLQASNFALRLAGNELQSVVGQVLLRDLVDGRGNVLGSYQLDFPLATQPPFGGLLRDAGGPLGVNATLVVQPDLSWNLDGSVTPRAGASESLLRNLQFLDAPDSSGGRHFSAAGSIN